MGQNGKSLKDIREMNRREVLRCLVYKEECTRRELTEMTGLSKMTITNLVNDLVERDQIEELDSDNPKNSSTTGPKAKVLRIKKGAIMALGIIVTNDEIIAVVVDLAKGILYENSVSIHDIDSNQRFINLLKKFVKKVLDDNRLIKDKIIGIGVTTENSLETLNGTILYETVSNKSDEISIQHILEKNFNYPVVSASDAQGAALAEMLYGGVKGKENFVYIGYGNQICSAFIYHRKLFRNDCNSGFDVAHMSVKFDGSVCHCGSRGCYQQYATIPILLQESKCYNFDKFLLDLECRHSQALRAIESFIQITAVVITNIINLCGTVSILMGNEASKFNPLVMKQIENIVNLHTVRKKNHYVKIYQSNLGYDAIKLGAGALVFQLLLLER